MSLWSHLFDTEYKQRRDIEDLKRQVGEVAVESAAEQNEDIRALRQKLNRLELVLEALFTHLETKGDLDREAFAKLVVQVDLADGVEDGRMGEDRSAQVRKCEACGKPVGRRRTECVYCGAEIKRKQRKRR